MKLVWSLLLSLGIISVCPASNISSFSPAYGSAGETIELLGSGFLFSPNTNVVTFGTFVSHNTFASLNTRLLAKVPTNAPVGSVVKLTVQTTGSAPFTHTADFRVISSGPYVAGLNPASGDANTMVEISGTHFVGSGGAITVRFNGVIAPATFDTTTAETLLRYRAPAGVTTGPVTVTRAGASTNISVAIFYATPAVTNFSPAFGRAGTNVVVKGRNFTGATAVFFNGLSAPILSNTATEVYTVLPAGATTGRIHVQTPAVGYLQSTSNFVVQPLITGFTPNKGKAGTVVTVAGENLWGATSVLFGGVSASPSGVTYSQLTATVPNNAPSGAITVQTTNGTFVSSQNFYMPPRIDSFSPSNGPMNSIVKIVGTNFLDASAVTFNGTPAVNFWVTNNGIIGAEVPEDVISGPIYVTTPHSTTNSTAFFYAAPIITGFNPDHGLPGTNVTILGTNFAGVTAVSFSGVAAAFAPPTNGILKVVVPTNAVTGPVSVSGPAGTTVSDAVFTLDYSSDLAVTVNAPASIQLGTDYTYVITITNKGPFAAPNVMLTNQLPGIVSLKSSSTTHGSLVLNGNPVTGNLGTINAHSKATVTLTVTPLSTGTAANMTSALGGYVDPTSGNNVVTTNTTIYVTPVLGMQRLSDTQLRLSWPVTLSEYFLQSTSDIAVSNSWSNVETEPEFIGDQKVVTETIGAGPRFYRLKR